jgi:hypothetical protein
LPIADRCTAAWLRARAWAMAGPMSFFERWLTLWVLLCIIAGTIIGVAAPELAQTVGRVQIAQLSLPVGLLIWAMIIPMLMKVDFAALHQLRSQRNSIGITLFVNWAVKPFSMALLGWIFIRHVFAPFLPAAQVDSYIAGLILLGAAPCTAMVFVGSNLCRGDANFTLTQVALNDLVMVFACAPIVALLLGVAAIPVPWETLFLSVVMYIVLPLAIAQFARQRLRRHGEAFFPARPDAHRALFDRRPAGHPGSASCLPGAGDQRAAADHRHARRAHPPAGPVDRRAWLLAQPKVLRCPCRGRPVNHDRSIKLFRTGCRGGNCPVWLRFRCCTGHCRRRPDRGPGDALAGASGESQQALVRSRPAPARAASRIALSKDQHPQGLGRRRLTSRCANEILPVNRSTTLAVLPSLLNPFDQPNLDKNS